MARAIAIFTRIKLVARMLVGARAVTRIKWIRLPLIHTRTYAYQEVRNVRFLENFCVRAE